MNGYNYVPPVTIPNAIAALAVIGIVAITVVATKGYVHFRDYISKNTKTN